MRLKTPATRVRSRPSAVSKRSWIVFFVGGSIGLYSLWALGTFLFVRFGRDIPDVRFVDLWLPTRWQNFHRARADHFLAEGERLLASGQHREAMPLLKAGLGRIPGNLDARLALAQLYSDIGRSDLAEEVLQAGVALHSDELRFLGAYFGFLLQAQKDQRVITVCRELLPLLPASTARDRFLALAAATAHYFRGNFDQAEDYIRIADLGRLREGRVLVAKIDWERGYRDLALIDLRVLALEWPADPQVYSELASKLRESGEIEAARRLTISFQIALPNLVTPRIDLIRIYHETGEIARAHAEAEALINGFPAGSEAHTALAEFAANSGDTALAQRLYEHAKARNMQSPSLALRAVEACLVARDYRAGLSLADDLLAGNPGWDEDHRPHFNSLRAIAHFGLDDRGEGELALNHFELHVRPRAESLLAIADRLLAVGATDPALRLLHRATETDPGNQAALSRLVTLELNLRRTANLSPHLRRLLTLRRPSPDLLRVAHHQLGSDAFLFVPDRAPLLADIRAHLATAEARVRRP